MPPCCKRPLRSLYAALQTIAAQAQRRDCKRATPPPTCKTLAALRAPVDAFFEHVMVNADDAALKDNRLACWPPCTKSMNQVADLARAGGVSALLHSTGTDTRLYRSVDLRLAIIRRFSFEGSYAHTRPRV